jgi:Protein of unknown function (DUF1553)/Protein of unknown function (DUF1549)
MMRFLPLLIVFALVDSLPAAEPLHRRFDPLIAVPPNIAVDSEFLRRITLDLAGTIPTADETKRFLFDPSPNKRTKRIDELLVRPTYSTRMANLFHVMWMERLGDNPEWTKYLTDSFAKNKPWDAMAREMLRADGTDGSSFFIAKRLENYGQNPVDYSGLTRDVGRLFLGKNFQCCECHDHLTVDEYKQQHFQGLHAFVRNAYLADAKAMKVAEKPTVDKIAFASVFTKVQMMTAPALPGGMMLEIPTFPKGDEFAVKPDRKTNTIGVPKFRTLAALADQLPSAENKDFARNFVNRVWFLFLGRGLVHPLDLHHKDNPASHPQLLDLLAKEFVEHKFDIRWLVREIVLSQAYQRSSIGTAKPESFAVALEKRLTAEQLFAAVLAATESKSNEALKAKFLKAFANQPREPEDEIAPSLKAALFLLHDKDVLELLKPKAGNLVDRLAKIEKSETIAEELYLAVLTRKPTTDEVKTATSFLVKRADRRADAIGKLVWALLASTEFGVNH